MNWSTGGTIAQKSWSGTLFGSEKNGSLCANGFNPHDTGTVVIGLGNHELVCAHRDPGVKSGSHTRAGSSWAVEASRPPVWEAATLSTTPS